MAFDKKRVIAEIEREIEQIDLPGGGGNLISIGVVERIIAQEGKVTIVLNLPPDLGAPGDDTEFGAGLVNAAATLRGLGLAR